MLFLEDSKTRKLERFYRWSMLSIFLFVVLIVVLSIVLRNKPEKLQGETLIAIALTYAIGSAVGSRLWAKKNCVTGEELRGYFYSKPLVKIAAFVTFISALIKFIASLK